MLARDAVGSRAALVRDVSRDYFATVGAQLWDGRFFDTSDRRSSSPVAIVNEPFAKRHFPERSPSYVHEHSGFSCVSSRHLRRQGAANRKPTLIRDTVLPGHSGDVRSLVLSSRLQTHGPVGPRGQTGG